MKNNNKLQIRISSDMMNELKKISEVTGLNVSVLCRFLLNKSVQQLRYDCKGDYSSLEFSLKHV